MIAFSKLLVIGVLLIHVTMYSGITAQGTSKCSTLPQVQHRLSAVIVECQNQVKEDMIRDALQQIRIAEQQQPQQYPPSASEQMLINSALAQNREDIHWMVKRFKRDVVDGNMFDHPTIMSPEDKEIAGCLMKCFFKKANALDFFGYPTLDGLVNLYTKNVSDHNYFMAVLKITNFCLKGVNIKYKINQHMGTALTESCNVAFDTFDCISDQIMDYCSGATTPVRRY